MAQAIKEQGNHELIIKDGDRLVYDYKEMIEVLQAAWGEYWNTPSAPSTREWEGQHLRLPQPTVPLQPITGALIREQLKQASRSSPGPDSWRFEEIGLLPEVAHEQLAELFGLIEEAEQFPKVMMSSWVAMISDKKGPLPPLKMRPINVLSSLYRLYGKCRLTLLQPWLNQQLPENISSYVAGRDFRRDAVLLAAEVERRSLKGEPPLHVISLDASKAFPSSSRARMWSVLQNEGLPQKLTNLFEWAYVNGDAVIRLCGRFAGSKHFALKRGDISGLPFFGYVFSWLAVTSVAACGQGVRGGADAGLCGRCEDFWRKQN